MQLNTTLLDALLPIVADLTANRPVADSRWDGLGGMPGMAALLQNAGCPLPQWRAIWEGAARGNPPEQTGRPQYALANISPTLAHLEQIHQIRAALTPALLDDLVATRVMPNLPTGTPTPTEMWLVLGSCSGGFVTDEGAMYVDLQVLRMLADDPAAVAQFLAHETWHAGHFNALDGHPHMREPWFMVLASLQSEGIVNHLIGGSYEFHQRFAAQGSEAERCRSAAFLAYADSMAAEQERRMAELSTALELLLTGDQTGYRQWHGTLPDIPGYLHGVLMARTIEQGLGRERLLATIPDPAAFCLIYHEAAQHARLSESLIERLRPLTRA